jgi:competence protein ComEA
MKQVKTICSVVCMMVMFVCANNMFAATNSNAKVNSDGPSIQKSIASKIDINNASVEALVELPGIGPRTAERIGEYRQLNGPFKTVEDLLNIKGIGPKVLQKLKPFVTVS